MSSMNIIILLVAIIYTAGYVLIVVGVRDAIDEEDLLAGPSTLSLFTNGEAAPASIPADGFVQVEQLSGNRAPLRELAIADTSR